MEDNNYGYNNAKRQGETRENQRNRNNVEKHSRFNKSKKLFNRASCNKTNIQKSWLEGSSDAGTDNTHIATSKRTIVIHKGNEIFKKQILKAPKNFRTKKRPSNIEKKMSYEHFFHSFAQLALLSETNTIFGRKTITSKIDVESYPNKIVSPSECTFIPSMGNQEVAIKNNIYNLKRVNAVEGKEINCKNQKKTPWIIQNADEFKQSHRAAVLTIPYLLSASKTQSTNLFLSNSSNVDVTEFRKLGNAKNCHISAQNHSGDSLLKNSFNNNLNFANNMFNSSTEEYDVDKLMKEENKRYLLYGKLLTEGENQINSVNEIITQLAKEKTNLEVKSKTNKIKNFAKAVGDFSSANKLKPHLIFNYNNEKLTHEPRIAPETEAMISTSSAFSHNES